MSIGRIMTLAEKLSAEELNALAALMVSIRRLDANQRKAVLRLFPAVQELGINDMGVVDALLFVVGKIAAASDQSVAQKQERPIQPGCVYVVRAEGTNAVKVGFSRDVKSRVATLQTASPFPLKLLGHFVGFDESHERAVHAGLASRRASGEWFVFEQNEDAYSIVEAALAKVGA